LVDPHTHLIYAGNRYEEFLRRSRGEPYEAILQAGGGIYETVRATVQAEDEALLSSAQARARSLLAHGVTSLEIKSGYGLEPEAELRLLRLIRQLKERVPQRVFATLLAHAVPRGWARKAYVRALVEEVLPQVAREHLALMADVFCDQGAFTVEEAEVLLTSAKGCGLGVKLHAEEALVAHTAHAALALGRPELGRLEPGAMADFVALEAPPLDPIYRFGEHPPLAVYIGGERVWF
jgi:imidazolonepropionase